MDARVKSTKQREARETSGRRVICGKLFNASEDNRSGENRESTGNEFRTQGKTEISKKLERGYSPQFKNKCCNFT
jgi:hypothetical protein